MVDKIKEVINSTRFWSLVIGAVVIYIQQQNWLGEKEMELIVTILGGYIGIRTVDKFAK